jgi:hypothetical protein
MNIRYFDEVVKKMKDLQEHSPLEATFFSKMKRILKWYKDFYTKKG